MTDEPTDEELRNQAQVLQARLEAAKQAVGLPIPENACGDPRYRDVIEALHELRQVYRRLGNRGDSGSRVSPEMPQRQTRHDPQTESRESPRTYYRPGNC